jgi:hypothetical protein
MDYSMIDSNIEPSGLRALLDGYAVRIDGFASSGVLLV